MTDMKQAVKFTFDTHFGEAPARPAAKAAAPRTPTEADLEKARSEAYAAGFAAGKEDGLASSERDLGAAMSQLAESAGSLLGALDAQTAGLRAEAAALALQAARKFAPALIATRPETEVVAVLRDCLSHLNREPHILLRVSSSLVDSMKETVDRMAMERGLSGRIILLGEPAMNADDCIVEWADGGVVRSRSDIEQAVTEIVTRYIETISPGKDVDALAIPESRSVGRE